MHHFKNVHVTLLTLFDIIYCLQCPLTFSNDAFSLCPVSISLVIMVFVNYGGGRYWFFRHESWNGEPHLVVLLILTIDYVTN